MPAQAESEAFLAQPKVMRSALDWVDRGAAAASIADVPIEHGGLIVGRLIAVVGVFFHRQWSFKVAVSGDEILRWDFVGVGDISSHHNRTPRPPGFDRRCTAREHEHPNVDGRYDSLARPLSGLGNVQHQEAFDRFCVHANIDGTGVYRRPPYRQAPLS